MGMSVYQEVENDMFSENFEHIIYGYPLGVKYFGR